MLRKTHNNKGQKQPKLKQIQKKQLKQESKFKSEFFSRTVKDVAFHLHEIRNNPL